MVAFKFKRKSSKNATYLFTCLIHLCLYFFPNTCLEVSYTGTTPAYDHLFFIPRVNSRVWRCSRLSFSCSSTFSWRPVTMYGWTTSPRVTVTDSMDSPTRHFQDILYNRNFTEILYAKQEIQKAIKFSLYLSLWTCAFIHDCPCATLTVGLWTYGGYHILSPLPHDRNVSTLGCDACLSLLQVFWSIGIGSRNFRPVRQITGMVQNGPNNRNGPKKTWLESFVSCLLFHITINIASLFH